MRSSIELVRGALSALSYVSPNEMRPVHVHRLQWLTERFAASTQVLADLEDLELVRDAQRLPSGYWLPTPTRQVPLDCGAIVVSSVPTCELHRRWGRSVEVAGLSRFQRTTSPELLVESLRTWMGGPVDTKQWTEDVLKDAREMMERVDLDLRELQIFTLLDSVARWHAGEAVIHAVRRNQIALCRTVRGSRVVSMFLARVGNGRLTHQAAIRTDQRRRIVWGVALLLRRPVRVAVREEEHKLLFDLWRALPNEEGRLLRALATVERLTDGRLRFSLSRTFLPIIRDTLRHLGVDIQVAHE